MLYIYILIYKTYAQASRCLMYRDVCRCVCSGLIKHTHSTCNTHFTILVPLSDRTDLLAIPLQNSIIRETYIAYYIVCCMHYIHTIVHKRHMKVHCILCLYTLHARVHGPTVCSTPDVPTHFAVHELYSTDDVYIYV